MELSKIPKNVPLIQIATNVESEGWLAMVMLVGTSVNSENQN